MFNTETGEKIEENDEYQNYLKTVEENIGENYIMSDAWNLTDYVEDIVSYISGFVVKGLKKFVNCSKCLNYLESEESASLLQKRKTFGRLVKASKFVINLCKEGEKFFRFFKTTQ